ncbi:aspartyl-phosphate phosphatase Spo0E family protein [Paenibacillus darwinianus]|uniref:aspartyl-phosphate phosphatase Spo0E family protein n=1 Tax=Paenibacillus darwinianus TaxID=1380763 RepID=UPI0009DE5C0E|nr:aspartyl-phosphate phosphatase Spo0E family protein [Paenibacillus darwinianus]
MELQEQIYQMKRELLQIAERNRMNLLHPEVIRASQELDTLIVKSMRPGAKTA